MKSGKTIIKNAGIDKNIYELIDINREGIISIKDIDKYMKQPEIKNQIKACKELEKETK